MIEEPKTVSPPDRLRDRCWTMAVTSLALIVISIWSWQQRPTLSTESSSIRLEQLP